MKLKSRRALVVVVVLALVALWLVVNPASYEAIFTRVENTGAEAAIEDSDNLEVGDVERRTDLGSGTASEVDAPLAAEVLEKLEVKGRAPKTGYSQASIHISQAGKYPGAGFS